MCKWVGPGWFLPVLSLGFGISSLGTAFVHTKSQVMAVRFLLGVFEAGLMPGIAYYLSRWYRRSELSFRLSLYIVMAPLAGAFGGLLASGILTLSHFGGLHSWRMIFAVEGVISIGLAILSFFTLTDRPASARWLSEAEKDMAIARVKSERVAQTEVLDGIDKKKIVRGIKNPITLSTAAIFLLNNVTVQGLAFFAPTIVRTIYPKKTTVMQQLYTVPPYVVGAFFTVLFPAISWYTDRRQIFMILSAPMVMIGYIMFLASKNPQVRYGATFLVASSAFALGPITNAQVAANVVSDTARSSAIGTNGMIHLTPIILLSSCANPSCCSHVRQHWRLDIHLVFSQLGRAGLPHRQRAQPRDLQHDARHLHAGALLDVAGQQAPRGHEHRGGAGWSGPERCQGSGLEAPCFPVEAVKEAQYRLFNARRTREGHVRRQGLYAGCLCHICSDRRGRMVNFI